MGPWEYNIRHKLCAIILDTLNRLVMSHNPDCVNILASTVMILSFRTDRSWQTVLTQIRIYTVCHSVSTIWTHDSIVKQSCSNFRVIMRTVKTLIRLSFRSAHRPFCWFCHRVAHMHKMFKEHVEVYYSPALKKWGYTGFSLSFCHSVIPSFRNLSNKNVSSHFSQEP